MGTATRCCSISVVLILLLALSSGLALAQGTAPDFPVCLEDTLFAVTLDLDALTHPFGQDTTTYSGEFNIQAEFPVFSKVFELRLTDGVSAKWNKTQWHQFVSSGVPPLLWTRS
jgi:hypothetical protein